VKRDVFDIPMMIIGNFLPILDWWPYLFLMKLFFFYSILWMDEIYTHIFFVTASSHLNWPFFATVNRAVFLSWLSSFLVFRRNKIHDLFFS
jgi:hypothetical protein